MDDVIFKVTNFLSMTKILVLTPSEAEGEQDVAGEEKVGWVIGETGQGLVVIELADRR